MILTHTAARVGQAVPTRCQYKLYGVVIPSRYRLLRLFLSRTLGGVLQDRLDVVIVMCTVMLCIFYDLSGY